jgi:hypothetical protein
MLNLKNLTLALFASFLMSQSAQATRIQVGWFFDANNDTSVAALSQTVTLSNGLMFDVDVTITSPQVGGVVDTSAGDGIAVGSGTNIDTDPEVINFALTINNVTNGASGYTRFIQSSTFEYIGTRDAVSGADRGSLSGGSLSGTANWVDANTSPPDFYGHQTSAQLFGGGAWEQGFFLNTSGGGQQTGPYNVSAGFNLPQVESGLSNGANFGVPVTSFSHSFVADPSGSYRLDGLVVEVFANPEPSSMLLGLVAALMGMICFGWRRTLQLIGIGKKKEAPAVSLSTMS